MSVIPWNATSCGACSSKTNMSSMMSSSSMYSTGTKAVFNAGKNFLTRLLKLPFNVTRSTTKGVRSVATTSITGLYDTLKDSIKGSTETVDETLMANIVGAVKQGTMTVGEEAIDALMTVIETARNGGNAPMEAVQVIFKAFVPQYQIMMM